MTNRVITIALIALTTVALLAEAARSAVGYHDRWREWLQLLVAQQVADTLDRQVQLGPITGISLDGVEARTLAVAEGRYLANGAVIRAERLRIAFDLAGILRREVAPAAGISRVRVEGAWVHAVRDTEGALNVEQLLPEPVGPPPPPEDRFQGIVTIVDSTVIYDDYAVDTLTGGPLNVELADVNAEIDMREIGWVTLEATAREQLGRFGRIAVRGQRETESGFAWGNGEISAVDAAFWFDTFIETDDIAVQGGSVDVSATVGLLPREDGEPEPVVAAYATVRNAAFTLAALEDRQVLADATLTGTMDGAQVHSVDARVGGTTVTGAGFVGDWEDPVLDLTFSGEVTRPDELLELLPELDPQTRAQVESVSVSGPLLVSGALVGPAEVANLSAQLEAPGEVRYASAEVGEIVAGPLELRVDALDLADVNVRGRVNVTLADPTDLEPLRAYLPEGMEGPIEVAPLEDVSADVLWSSQIPLLRTELAIPRLAVGEVAVAGLRANVSMADDVIFLSDLRAEPLGGRLAADAVIDIGGDEGPWAWARGTIDGLELARLEDLPLLEELAGLGGELSGTFAGEFRDGAPFAIANAVIEQPRYQEYSAETVRALIVIDEDAVDVRGATFQDPLGVVWARGVVPFEGEMAAQFAVAGVDLERVVERFEFDAEGLEGEVFLTGSAAGTLEEPRIDTTLRAFGLEYEGYEIDALTADLEGGLAELEVRNLFASSGRIVARMNGTLTEIDLDESDAALSGTVRLTGPVDRHALELADLEDEDLVGAVNATIEVSGTLKQPGAEGTVYLDHARYETVATDDAVMAVSLRGDVLQMTELRVPVGDAVISGSASVTSLYDEPLVSATVLAEDVVLQDLALVQETGLPLSGRVSLPHLNVEGPLDALTGFALIEATDLQLDDEPIGAVTAVVVLDRDVLMLQRTTLALAGGKLSLDGRYRLDQRRIEPSHIKLDDVAIPELLQFAEPLARYLSQADGEDASSGDDSPARQLASASLRLGGRLDGSFEVQGVVPEPAPEGAETEAVIRNVLDALEGTAAVSIRRPSFDNKHLPDTKLHAQLGEGPEVALQIEAMEGDALITADGRWEPGGEVEMLTEVSALHLALLRPWAPGAAEAVGGRLNLTVQTTGTLDDPTFIGSIDITEPEAHGVRFDLISAPIISYDGEVLEINSLVLRESDEEFFVNGSIPLDWDTMSVPGDGELQVVMRADGTDLAIFPPVLADAFGEPGEGPLSEVKATGTFDSLVKIGGTPRRPELNGEVTVRAPSIKTPWLSSPIEDVALNVTFTGGAAGAPEDGSVRGGTRMTVEEFTARLESTTVMAGGTADLAEYDLAGLTANRYDLWATVDAPKQALGSDGLALRKLGGEVRLATQESGLHLLTVDGVGAELGGGSAGIDGTVEIATFVPSEMAQNHLDLAIVADRARPRYGNLFMGTVDGRIGIANSAAGEPISMSGLMTLSHAVIGVPPLARRGEEEAGLYGMPADFPSASLDVSVAIGPDVRVRTTGLTAPLEPTQRAVWLYGDPQRPKLRGYVEVQEGEAVVSGGVLNVETAGVDFLLGPRRGLYREPPVELELEGRIWATATRTIDQTVVDGRRLEDVLIELQVGGTLPDHIHVQVSSSPPLAEEQIYALLGTAPFTGGGGLAAGGDLEDVLSEQFVSALGAAFRHYIFQPFQEDLRDILGLSVFEVSFAFDQPVDVRLGGYLIEDLLITYETSVYGATETDYELEVSYRIERRFQLTYETNDENNNRLLVQYVYEF